MRDTTVPTPAPVQRPDIGRAANGKGKIMLKIYSDVYPSGGTKPAAPTAPVTPPAAPTVVPTYRPGPVEIPGVISQTQQLFKPYTPKE